MANVTLRVDDETWAAVKAAAAREGQSANAYVAGVLTAVTDPTSAGDAIERVRERLRRAGLLEEAPRSTKPRPSRAAVRAAGRRAGRGKPVSDYVIEGRG
ncbi:MAG TPA: hypothetical protein PKD63_06280 [Solirubrobacteraceae bacterium]|jgi:uncharacterized protein (DUF1778 family)|nr:hypothetical protein [Solirubrobacteraceae bacterium]